MAGVENTYTFQVTRNATKKSVSASIRDAYKVTPERVHLVNMPGKKVFVRGKAGQQARGKKAYVHLKKGDKIELL
jgi:ribosomal protein L23